MNRIIVWKQRGGVDERRHILGNVSRWNWLFIGESVILLLLCTFHAVDAGHYVDFIPINGTFQNYNPVRRFLGGQVPYRDFQDYLGLGHLYFGSLVTGLLGGSYRDSLIAFSFLTIVSLALFSYIIGLAILEKKETAIAMTNVVLSCLLISPNFFIKWTGDMADIAVAMAGALDAANSARFIRGMILPVVCLLLWGACFCYKKIGTKSVWIAKHKEDAACVGIGLLAGFAFVWSNDYGISCWICLAVILFWISLSRTRKVTKTLKNIVIELTASAVGIFMAVEIFTWGNFSGWVSSTFGTGDFQRWYYNDGKSYYVTDVDFSWIMLLQAEICFVYMIKLFRERASIGAIRRYGIPAFCNMVCFCAANEYKLLSGGDRREVAFATLFLTMLYEIIRHLPYFERGQRKEKLSVALSFLIGAAWIIAAANEEFAFRYLTVKEGTYVERMDGNLTSLGEDLLRTDEFLDGESFFSTYASAQEVVSDIYQPSGTDYIIHVLGDAQRESYLNIFHTADFRYASTIKDGYSYWTYWMERANWFWYRDLYENWHPVYANTYEVYWEKNEAADTKNTIEDGIDVEIVDADDSIKIQVRTKEPVNGIADAYIDYRVNKKSNRSAKLAFQTLLRVRNTGQIYAQSEEHESNYLRSQSKEYIPIPIVNGYGEVTLSARPERSTYLEINYVACTRIFTCTSDYIEVAGITVGDQETVLRVHNTLKNRNALTEISAVEIQDHVYAVDEVAEDSEYMMLHIKGNIDYEENKSNFMKIFRDRNKGYGG